MSDIAVSSGVRAPSGAVRPSGGARTGGCPSARFVLAGVAAALLATGCGESEAGEASRLSMVQVERQDLALTAEATGQLDPLRKVEIKSRAAGEIIEVAVDTGDRVEPGTLLARVDPRDVQNDFDQAEADWEVAQERHRNSQAELERSENLLAAGVITEQEHEGRNLDFANARAQLIRAQTSLDLARVRLEDATIRSRMAGTVLERLVEEGQVITSASGSVSDGTVLFTVASLDVMEVRTLVDETDVGRIQAGMPVTVVVDAHPDRTFEGQVEKIEPQAQIESNVVMYPVIVHLDNSAGILRPGMSAEVTILLAERPNALTLPNNAIVMPSEVQAAGAVLGVPESRLELGPAAFRELAQQNAPEGAAGAEEGAASRMPEEGERPDREAIREAMASGDRQAAMEAMGEGGRAAMRGAFAGRRAGGRQARGDAEVRQGVVFVVDAAGEVTPRAVLLGVNDWSNSEILAGLEEGEQVALIGGAQLQAQQEARSQNMRSRMGGLPFGR